MFKAKNENDQWVAAKDAIVGRSYYCPVCRERVALIFDSKSFIEHFRHHPNSTCHYGAGETIEHAETKLGLASSLATVVGLSNVSVEHTLPDGQRPDVYFETHNQGVAIEVQRSSITANDLYGKIESYSDKKVASLWLTADLKRYLNSVSLDHISPSGALPSYVRRIAGLTDDVAFDRFSDPALRATSVVGVQLVLQQKREYVPGKEEPVIKLYWGTDSYSLPSGVVRRDIADNGHSRWLWIPRSERGKGVISTRPRRVMRRSEVVSRPGLVDCTRAPVEAELRNQQFVIESLDAQLAELASHDTERATVQLSLLDSGQLIYAGPVRQSWNDNQNDSFSQMLFDMSIKKLREWGYK